MSCEKFEQQIYLYRELTSSEKEGLERHVAVCADCCEVLEQVKQQSAWMQVAASDKARARDPERLVHTILHSLEPKRGPISLWSASFVEGPWVRYGLSAASLLFIGVFLFEQPWKEQALGRRVIAGQPTGAKHAPVMDTQTFLEFHRKNRGVQETTLFTSYLDCVKRDDCKDNTVWNFKTKMKL